MLYRRGFTRTELVVVVFVVLVLAASVMPSIQYNQNQSRLRYCGNRNLRMVGIGLATYDDVFRSFPPGAIVRDENPARTYDSIHAILLPYFEESDFSSFCRSGDWRGQAEQIPSVYMPFYNCPSSDGENPILDKLRNELLTGQGSPYPATQLYGTTNYVFCRGVTDAWCRCWLEDGNRVPPSERGMFDMNWAVRPRDVTDGLSKTIAVGEGADGQAWQLSDRSGAVIDRSRPAGADKYGMQRAAYQAWLAMEPATLAESEQGLRVASVFACTLEPMNKHPVTDSWADVDSLDDCRKSLPSAVGTRGATTEGGWHSTPNFRSDHAGGGNFLFADGSVHFLTDDIDMLLYQQLSTHQGGERVDVPE